MRTSIKITNETLFYETVISVDTTGLIGLNGTIEIETVANGCKGITGEHGEKEYEQEFGFILVCEL